MVSSGTYIEIRDSAIKQCGRPSAEVLSGEMLRIKASFPKIPKETLMELKESFLRNQFTDEMIKDSVSKVIDEYDGWDKQPAVANFIRAGKREVPLHTYSEYIKLLNERGKFINEEIEWVEVDKGRYFIWKKEIIGNDWLKDYLTEKNSV